MCRAKKPAGTATGPSSPPVLLITTGQPDPRLPGTVHTAVEEITAAGREPGARAVAVVGDIREEADVQRAVGTAVQGFGGVDVVVDDASASNLTPPPSSGPALRPPAAGRQPGHLAAHHGRPAAPGRLPRRAGAHVLPPVDLVPQWSGMAPTYSMSTYGMTLGFAAELAAQGVRADCRWPRTTIATAVVDVIGGEELASRSRSPAITGDAAVALLTDPSRPTGRTFVDDDVLCTAGVTDLSGSPGRPRAQLDWSVGPA